MLLCLRKWLHTVSALMRLRRRTVKFAVVDAWIWYGYLTELTSDGDILNMVDSKWCQICWKRLNNGRLVFCEPKMFCNNVWGNLSYPLTFQQAKTLIFIRFLHSAKKDFDNTNFLTKLRHEKYLTLFDTKILLLYEIPFVYDCVKNVLAHHEMNVQ